MVDKCGINGDEGNDEEVDEMGVKHGVVKCEKVVGGEDEISDSDLVC
jgi:hypothetical protein